MSFQLGGMCVVLLARLWIRACKNFPILRRTHHNSFITMSTSFRGASRTLTEQSSAASQDDLQKILFSPEAIKKYATECNLGTHNWIRADAAISIKPLVPETTGGLIRNLFKSKYERGEIKSKGYMSVAQVLCGVIRTTSLDAEGSVRLYLCDLGDSLREPIDNQSVTLQNSELPALVSFHPTYDCPMEEVNGVPRCFAMVIERHGYVGHLGTTVSVCSNWHADFCQKSNNYKHHNAGKTLILPFNRLANHTRPGAVARLLRQQLNVVDKTQYLLPSTGVMQSNGADPSVSESGDKYQSIPVSSVGKPSRYVVPPNRAPAKGSLN